MLKKNYKHSSKQIHPILRIHSYTDILLPCANTTNTEIEELDLASHIAVISCGVAVIRVVLGMISRTTWHTASQIPFPTTPWVVIRDAPGLTTQTTQLAYH